jgi:hypothetical protein
VVQTLTAGAPGAQDGPGLNAAGLRNLAVAGKSSAYSQLHNLDERGSLSIELEVWYEISSYGSKTNMFPSAADASILTQF